MHASPDLYISTVFGHKKPVPEFIDPIFAKTSPKRSFSMTENKRFGLLLAKTRSINLGTWVWIHSYRTLFVAVEVMDVEDQLLARAERRTSVLTSTNFHPTVSMQINDSKNFFS
jgi:hypothetical protein